MTGKQKKTDPPFGENDQAKGTADDVLDSWENESLESSDDEPNDDVSTVGKHSSASPVTTASTSRTNTRSGTNTPSDLANSPQHQHGIRAPPSTPLAGSLGSNSGWSAPDRPARAASATSTTSRTSSTPASTTNTSPDGGASKRPEKQTAVANRLIAGALGVRSHRSDEQKAYDRAVQDNERRRIARQREEEASRRLEEERAKDAMWEE